MSDRELLEQFRNGSQESFAELVRRHVGWIHALARRRVGGDAHAAEDVTQATFIVLVRRARELRPADLDRLPGWLFRVACYASARARRDAARRAAHESEAAMQRFEEERASARSDEPDWDELALMLDELVGRLRQSDREAVLLRFYRQMSYSEVGAATGLSEEAARKRVDRALDKLRRIAQDKGLVKVTATSLAALLAAHAPGPGAAHGLAAAATTAALASANATQVTGLAGTLANGAIHMMHMAKLKLVGAIAAIILLSGGVGALAIHQVIAGPPPSEPNASAAAPVDAAAPATMAAPPQPLANAAVTPLGWTMMRVRVSDLDLANAIQQTVRELGAWKDQGNGQRSLPSLTQAGRSWSNAAGQVEAMRGRTEFDCKNGERYVIQTIHITGEPTLVLLDTRSQEQTAEFLLFNTLTQKLTQTMSARRGSEVSELLNTLSDQFAELQTKVQANNFAGARADTDAIIGGAERLATKFEGTKVQARFKEGADLLRALAAALDKQDRAAALELTAKLNQLGPRIMQDMPRGSSPTPQPATRN